jgi:hypothetical protein
VLIHKEAYSSSRIRPRAFLFLLLLSAFVLTTLPCQAQYSSAWEVEWRSDGGDAGDGYYALSGKGSNSVTSRTFPEDANDPYDTNGTINGTSAPHSWDFPANNSATASASVSNLQWDSPNIHIDQFINALIGGNVKSRCDNISLKVHFYPVWHRYNPETFEEETSLTKPAGAPPLPAQVKILVETTVTAMAGVSGSGSATATATNSLGDTATFSATSAVYPNWQTETKKRWVPKSTSGGPIEIEVTGSGTAEAEMSAQTDYGGAFAQGSISARARVENRTVHISNSSMEYGGNFQKGFGGLRTENLRDSYGAMSVDSVVPWHVVDDPWDPDYQSNYGDGGWKFETALTAIPIGFSPGFLSTLGGDLIQVNWSNSGEGTINNSTFNKWTTFLQKTFVPDSLTSTPWPVGKTSTVSISVTDESIDNDPGIENTYTIRWHAPYENWATVGSPEEVPSSGASFQPSKATFPHPENVSGSFTPSSLIIGDWTWANNLIVITGAYSPQDWATDIKFKLLLAAIQVGITFLPQPEQISTTWSQLWGDTANSTWLDPKDDQHQDEFEVSVTVNAIDQRQAFEGDAYGTNGYQGPARQYTQVYKKRVWKGVFKRIIVTNPDPGNH